MKCLTIMGLFIYLCSKCLSIWPLTLLFVVSRLFHIIQCSDLSGRRAACVQISREWGNDVWVMDVRNVSTMSKKPGIWHKQFFLSFQPRLSRSPSFYVNVPFHHRINISLGAYPWPCLLLLRWENASYFPRRPFSQTNTFSSIKILHRRGWTWAGRSEGLLWDHRRKVLKGFQNTVVWAWHVPDISAS